MNRYEELVRGALKEDGARFLRKTKHEVWELSSGMKYTMPVSPSDFRAWMNSWTDIKNILGLNGVRGVPGERRERRRTQQVVSVARVATLSSGGTTSIADQLQSFVVRPAVRHTHSTTIRHPRHRHDRSDTHSTGQTPQLDLSGLVAKFSA